LPDPSEKPLWDLRAYTKEREPVTSVMFNPDGKTFSTSSSNNLSLVSRALKFWDLSSGENIGERRQLLGSEVSYSPDGSFIALDISEGTAFIDLGNNSTFHTLKNVSHSALSLMDGPQGTKLALSRMQSNTLSFTDALSGEVFENLKMEYEATGEYALSNDGLRIACGCKNGEIALWTLDGGWSSEQLRGPFEATESLTFSPESNLLACMDSMGVHIVNLNSGEFTLIPVIANEHYTFVIFSPNGSLVAIGGDSGRVLLWDIRRLTKDQSVGNQYQNAMACSADGTRLALWGYYTKRLSVWDFSKRIELFSCPAKGQSFVEFSRDGKYMVIHTMASEEANTTSTTELWDVARQKRIFNLEKRRTDYAAFNHDGSLFHTFNGEHNETIELWDTATGKLKHTLNSKEGFHYSEFNADSTLLAHYHDVELDIWDVKRGVISHTIHDISGSDKLLFSHDNKTLVAVGMYDENLSVIDVQTGTLRLKLKIHEANKAAAGTTNKLAFSPDGELFLSSSDVEKTTKVWSTKNWQVRYTIPAWGAAEFSPDGRLLLLESQSLKSDTMIGQVSLVLFDALTGRRIRSLENSSSVFAKAHFSRRRNAIVSMAGREILMWPLDVLARSHREFLPEVRALTGLHVVNMKCVENPKWPRSYYEHPARIAMNLRVKERTTLFSRRWADQFEGYRYRYVRDGDGKVRREQVPRRKKDRVTGLYYGEPSFFGKPLGEVDFVQWFSKKHPAIAKVIAQLRE